MKKVFNNIMRGVVALSIFAIAGCADTSIDSQPEAAANIQTDARESYDFTAIAPMSASFSVSANTPWRVESDAQWCTVTPSMSASSSLVETITISVTENTEYTPREATVTILGTDIDFVRTVAIKQDSNADLIVLTPSAPVEAGGANVEITVHSNKAWEYFALTDILQNADITSGDGSGDATITIKVPANPGLSREGQFMIRTALEERTYTIMQDGMVLRTSIGAVNLGWDEFEYTVPVDANIDWVAKISEGAESWLAVEKTNATTLVVKALAYNELLMAKSAEIIISPAADIPGIDDIVIPVSQDICYTLHASAEIVEGGVKFPLQAVTHFISKFRYRHGCFTIEFADGIQSVTSRLMFDMVHYSGDANVGNYRLFVATNDAQNSVDPPANRTRVQGGASMACTPWQTIFWTNEATRLTGDDCHKIQTIQYELKKNDAGATVGRSYFKLTTGREVEVLQTIPAPADPEDMTHVMRFQLTNQVAGAANDYFIIKSIKFEPYEGFESNE